MSAKDKVQAPIRFYPEQYEKIREKAQYDGLTYQKLAEVLFRLYLKNNKEVMKHVNKFVEQLGGQVKNKPMFNEIESDDLLRLIEERYSPLSNSSKGLQVILEEIENE